MEEASSSSDYSALQEDVKGDYVLLEDAEQYHTDDEGNQYHSLELMVDHVKDEGMYYQQQNDHDHLGGENKNDELPKGQIILDQERFLPIANVARIMKRMIPESGKLAKEAKECVQECVSEFISFLTSEASDKCLAEKRRTITADDLLDALTSTGLGKYVEPVRALLNRHKCTTKFINSSIAPGSRLPYSDYTEQPTTSRSQQPIPSSSQMVTVIPAGSHSFTNAGPSYAFVMQQTPGSHTLSTTNFSPNSKNVFTTSSASVSIQENHHGRQSYQTTDNNIQHQIRNSSNSQVGEFYPETMVLSDPTTSTGQTQQFQIVTQQRPIYATGEDGNPVTLVPGGEVLNNGESAPANHGALLHPQNMQIYVDPVSKQHYVAVETPDGPPHLFPITIKDEPVTMSIAENGLSSGSTTSFAVVQTSNSNKQLEQANHSENSNEGPMSQ